MRIAAVLLVFGLVVAGCGGGSSHSSAPSSASSSASSSPTTSSAPVAPDTVRIKDFSFSPNPITVAPGAVVTVTNTDATTHTVTSGSFDTGRVGAHSSATFTAPATPGTYAFHCNIHQYMKATLIVR